MQYLAEESDVWDIIPCVIISLSRRFGQSCCHKFKT